MAGALSEQEVIDLVKCECGAKKGERCVYMRPLYGVNKDDPKIGTPTQRVHTTRRTRARLKRHHLDRNAVLLTIPKSEQATIALAERTFEQRERVALMTWLTHHADILIGAST